MDGPQDLTLFCKKICETSKSSNIQQKYNESRFCLPIIYKIKNSIVFTKQLYNCVPTFNEKTPVPRVYKKHNNEGIYEIWVL